MAPNSQSLSVIWRKPQFSPRIRNQSSVKAEWLKLVKYGYATREFPDPANGFCDVAKARPSE
jgi:hypothetical protein